MTAMCFLNSDFKGPAAWQSPYPPLGVPLIGVTAVGCLCVVYLWTGRDLRKIAFCCMN